MRDKEYKKLTKEEAEELHKLIEQLDETVPDPEPDSVDMIKKIWIVVMIILLFLNILVLCLRILLWLD